MTTTAFGAFINILTLMGSAIAFIAVVRYRLFFPCSLFPFPCSLFPLLCSLLPAPYSLKTRNLYFTSRRIAIFKK
ncbi:MULTISPECIES: hypothetical protein [unclassified Moorena]|uniref:hypothetical protein n=1 Tax=unclassified Moorena TaxID=2683338 RepID=UPI001400D490|nr:MULTISPECIES: hypothetical protein [unclassified Moorena]NEO13482.1 hypothetical protein [Moorena sp. SIO3E8]NEP98430.1 hypothetical protein [Moorena sp. SIO3F7]NEQ63529.1 hypothetical protein [Moorena sp. SIO4A1]